MKYKSISKKLRNLPEIIYPSIDLHTYDRKEETKKEDLVSENEKNEASPSSDKTENTENSTKTDDNTDQKAHAFTHDSAGDESRQRSN